MARGTYITVRTRGPEHSPASAAALLAKSFAELYTTLHEITTNRNDSPGIHDTDEQHANGLRYATVIGQCAFFAQLLRYDDPRHVCYQGFSPWQVDQVDTRRVYDAVRNWAVNLTTPVEGENTDEVWELFLEAVATAEKLLADPENTELRAKTFALIDHLGEVAPATGQKRNWHWRVYNYAENIAPEYRRWFTHLLDPADVQLPRI